MKTCTLAAGLCLMLAQSPASAQAQPESGLAGLSWLAGCWAREGAEPGSAEQWMPPLAGAMFGMARTIKAGRTAEYEFLRIEQEADGALVYTALPSRQSLTSFRLLRQLPQEVVFENPAHDFPQRVSYRLAAPGELLAAIEGNRRGEWRRIEFRFRRERCE